MHNTAYSTPSYAIQLSGQKTTNNKEEKKPHVELHHIKRS